jgi:GNAT superfamily N-acetyltransferase
MLWGMLSSRESVASADPQGPSRRAAAAGPGLVRLETSGTSLESICPELEDRRVREAKRRALRLFKSLSCAGDLHRIRTDPRGRRLQGIFLTATYRADVYWQPCHVAALLRHIRQWCQRRGVEPRYVWCAEQHKSGRVHYHAILFVPRGLMLPKPDKQGWWPHGMTKIERCRKQSVGYLIKYASKAREVSKPWPKGCRLHGHGGLELCERVRRSWWVLPKYIRAQVEPEQRVRRAAGGGWVSAVSGEWWPAWQPPELVEAIKRFAA